MRWPTLYLRDAWRRTVGRWVAGFLVDAMNSRRVFKNDFTMALGKVLAQQKT